MFKPRTIVVNISFKQITNLELSVKIGEHIDGFGSGRMISVESDLSRQIVVPFREIPLGVSSCLLCSTALRVSTSPKSCCRWFQDYNILQLTIGWWSQATTFFNIPGSNGSGNRGGHTTVVSRGFRLGFKTPGPKFRKVHGMTWELLSIGKASCPTW